MKTKHVLLIGLTGIALSYAAPKAQAGGVSFGLSIGIGLPVPTVVYRPPAVCAPVPVVVPAPPVVCRPPVVCAPTVVPAPRVVYPPRVVCAPQVVHPRYVAVVQNRGHGHPPGHYRHYKSHPHHR